MDASSKVLGTVLLQDNLSIAHASKTLTNCPQKYAQIEKEMLVVVIGCTRFHKYIYGMSSVEIETDHKQLKVCSPRNFGTVSSTILYYTKLHIFLWWHRMVAFPQARKCCPPKETNLVHDECSGLSHTILGNALVLASHYSVLQCASYVAFWSLVERHTFQSDALGLFV